MVSVRLHRSVEPATAAAPAAVLQPQQKRFRADALDVGLHGGSGSPRDLSGQNAGVGDLAPQETLDSKPFLKRRSQKIHTHKVDWSHVKPRIVSRCVCRGPCTQNIPSRRNAQQKSPSSTVSV